MRTRSVVGSLIAAFFPIGFGACPPHPVTPDAGDAGPPALDVEPPVDVGDGSVPIVVDAAPLNDAAPNVAPDVAPDVVVNECTPACAALKRVGCPYGSKPDCAVTLARDLGTGKITDVNSRPFTCADVAKVQTKADAAKLRFTCQ